MLMSPPKENSKTLIYPYRVLLFPIVFIVCCIPFVVSNIIIIFNERSSELLQISAQFVLFLQGIFYPICFFFYPPFLSIIKSCFTKRKKSNKISKIEIHTSHAETNSSNSLSQSLTQTIYG